ncbi:hypothetical protein CCR75_000243 [Bremia lactucae]|uniref:TBC1 domain family member 23 n=1 Tax=Bremia lactucae TaxID=4779 RepID=A0A976FDM2_BRELC|nr:hypothetical protein CCR75_000243 [Bremia lactucae]
MSSTDNNDVFGKNINSDAIVAITLARVDSDDDEPSSNDNRGKHDKLIESCQPHQGPNWEQIGSHEQDEFSSWLNGEGPLKAIRSATLNMSTPLYHPLPPLTPAAVQLVTFASISVDDTDNREGILEASDTNARGASHVEEEFFDRMLDNYLSTNDEMHRSSSAMAPLPSFSIDDNDDFEQLLQGASASTYITYKPIDNVSLDDDDDLEPSTQRGNSSLSLQINCQVQTPPKCQIDMAAVRIRFLKTGMLPVGSRLALWHRAEVEDTASMNAILTTPRSLPSQVLLRTEVEALCSRLSSSAAYSRILREMEDSMRGTHLLFIYNAESLFIHLCTQLGVDYSSEMALTFASLLLASGFEPLYPEIAEILSAPCCRFLPHLSRNLSLHSLSSSQRPTLKQLLLYYSPRLASYLSQHFTSWHHTPHKNCNEKGECGTIPDSWLSSFFEDIGTGSDSANFDFLLKVWDCSLVMEAYVAHENAPLLTVFFITLYAVIMAENALMRMPREQLRHSMAVTLLNSLLHGEVTKSANFVQDVRQLLECTPPSICTKLRNFAMKSSEAVDYKSVGVQAVSTSFGTSSRCGMRNLHTASTRSIHNDASSMTFNMPINLLTNVPVNYTAALPSSTSNASKNFIQAQQLKHVQAMGIAPVSVALEAQEIISSVFGIEGHETEFTRYFIVDCRKYEDSQCGRFPKAFHFDPAANSDAALVDQVIAALGPSKHSGVHVCVMGQGYAHIAEELRRFQLQQGVPAASPFSLSEQLHAKDQMRVRSSKEFLLKHGYPRVSVINGGYAAAHGFLFRSHDLTVDYLADHNTLNCKLCQHDGSMNAILPSHFSQVEGSDKKRESDNCRDFGRSKISKMSDELPHTSVEGSKYTDIDLISPSADFKILATDSYYSSVAGAFKTGSKTLLNPTVGGTKWLFKKSAARTAEFANAAAYMSNLSSKNVTGSMQGVTVVDTSSEVLEKKTKQAMPNLSKFRNSLAAIGSESLEMLKKVESVMEHVVEQVSVVTSSSAARIRVPFPSTSSPSLKDAAAVATQSTSQSQSVSTNSASALLKSRAALSPDPAYSTFYHESTDELFAIDDDDDDGYNEGQFVQRIELSNSRSSFMSSFASDSPVAAESVHNIVK